MQGFLLSFLKTRWLLLLVLLVFLCFKIPQLRYPFYIDEGWVYAPAVKTMALHGPSLLPGSIPPDLSRGHPLMFHFLCALWIRCFGSSNIAIHSFPLLLSVIFLIVLFECCLRLFGHKAAVLLLLLVTTRVIFFVQSTFVYPEIMLAMFAFLSLYCYCKDYLLLTSLMLFMLFFTKEGGLVFGAVIGVDALVAIFRRSENVRRRWLRLAAVLAPACLIGLFFVLQNAKFGWYVLPEHTDMIKPDWNAYYIMFKSGLYWAFRGDNAMYVLVFFIILLSLVPALKFKNIRYLFLIPPAFIVYAQAEMFPTKADGGVIWMLLYILFFTVPVYYVLQLNKTLDESAQRFVLLLGICVVAFLFYSSLTRIAYRYLLVDIIFVLIFLALCTSTYVTTGGKNLFYFAICCIALIGAYGFYSNDRVEDTQLGAFKVMNVQMQELAYLEKENAYNKEIAYGCGYECGPFTDTLEGFLSSGRSFTRMERFPVGPHTEYAIFGNRCGVGDDYTRMLTNPDFQTVYKVRDGEIWAEIFKRKYNQAK